MSDDRDMSQAEIPSAPPKNMILRIAAATAFAVAVRVAVTIMMTGGGPVSEAPRQLDSTTRIQAAPAISTVRPEAKSPAAGQLSQALPRRE